MKPKLDEFPYCFLFEGKWYFATEEAKDELESLGMKILPR